MRFTFENGSMIGGFRSIQDYSGSGASHIMTFNDISSFEGEIVGSWAKNAGGGAQVNGNNVGFIVGGTTPADVALAITNSYLQSIPGVGAPGNSSYGYNLSNFNVNTNGKVPFSSLSSGAQSKYNAVVALSKSYA